MRIGVLGCNYKSCDLSTREAFVQGCIKCFGGEKLSSLPGVLLSTCNRMEIYFSALDLATFHSELLHLLRREIPIPFEPWLYSYFGVDCFTHLAFVTAGLDSVVIGESEIQRQVKEAYEKACLYSSLPSVLHFLFQKSLKIAKNVRTSFPLEKGKISFSNLVFQLCKHLFQNISSSSVLLMGNSEINRNMMAFFKAKKMNQLTICTRAPHSAQELIKDYQVNIIDWSRLLDWVNYDIVICGTHHSSYLLQPEQVNKLENLKTKIIFDLSVPRNVDPKLARHPHLTLLNIEELSQIITLKQKIHVEHVLSAEEWAAKAVQKQLAFYREKENKHHNNQLLCV